MKKMWMQWKRKWLPYVIAYSAKYAIRFLLRTCRIRIHGIDKFVKTAQESPCILMLWHDQLVLVPEIVTTFTSDFICTAFISKSRDGDPLELVTKSYSRGRVLRVPHNTRHQALSRVIDILRGKSELDKATDSRVVIITPDGPRGPRHVVKPGVIVAARESSAKIVPFSWKASRFWQLNTWDRMQIPKPFTTLHITFGDPIVLSTMGKDSLDQDAEMLRDILIHQRDDTVGDDHLNEENLRSKR
ncbi:MAG: lysophospholipid acyltransferase family protein [Parachlamydiaceae bacterium]